MYPFPPLRKYSDYHGNIELYTIQSGPEWGPQKVIRALKLDATRQTSHSAYTQDTGLDMTSESEIDTKSDYLLFTALNLYEGLVNSTFGCVDVVDRAGTKPHCFMQPCHLRDGVEALTKLKVITPLTVLSKMNLDPGVRADHHNIYEKIKVWDEGQRKEWDNRFSRLPKRESIHSSVLGL